MWGSHVLRVIMTYANQDPCAIDQNGHSAARVYIMYVIETESVLFCLFKDTRF